ncbi:hypothetical protein K469DRAFT_786049 [Zopfia rhizophila CBS 207.26]|uniref:Uncharacterized protein n=1 Tax=Zopfia rhizophila CBS 207.26 TaxID=1314779 RepID=A0A6A6DYL6_9PEZI|nr:hypothetical protein K469DRAFT_786049 [Zopfia rhizophila CBS 207.26]
MGQTWVITAPRANEVLNFGGKLGEILFDGSAESLVELLAVPVRPDDSMQKMEQNEARLCTDARPMKRKVEDDVSEQSTQRWKNRRMQSCEDKREAEVTAKPLLLNLPTELHNLNLSLTNRYFWSIGRKHIQTYFMSFLGPWAGENIVCVGQYIEAGDYPPDMLTKNEEYELSQHQDENGRLMTLFDFTREYYEEIKGNVSILITLLGQLLDSEQYSRMSGFDRSQVMDTIWPKASKFYPSDQPWILRNLTIKEFVRSEPIALRPEYIHGPNIDFLGFSEVVLLRICWSTGSSISMEYDGNIHRGVWAGHCFDITTLGKAHREYGG